MATAHQILKQGFLRDMKSPQQWLTLSDGSILTRQEQYVLRQVAAGEIADLKKAFGEAEADRRLRGRFLEELLSGELPGIKISPQGIVINNAIVEGPINLPGVEINFPIELNDCIFREPVEFRDARFANNLSLAGSHFLQRADFDRIKVAVNLFCMKAVFFDVANFGGAGIARQLSAIGAKFLCEDHRANFNHLVGG
ncbi:MAG: pentapeptide repeat-containing protein, partial [Deltaproteobacteria bacterium]|nr:pentapeptide repeat-containing protein [Deltaproteobacteria bacterium]